MRNLTVMITGCSKHSKEIVDCLTQNEDGRKVDIVAVNMDGNKLLRHGTTYQYIAPPITDTGYIPFLKKVCEETHTDIIIPYITAELELMAEHKEEFEQMGVKVSVASKESLEILNNKEKFGEMFQRYAPGQCATDDVHAAKIICEAHKNKKMKVCCKISGKCGGTGFCIVDNEKAYDISLFNRCGVNRYISDQDLYKIIENGNRVILQEYVEGIDYSVCVLADHGNALAMAGYAGFDMEFGAVVNGQIITNEKAFEIARMIVKELGVDGNACFDFILEGVTGETLKNMTVESGMRAMQTAPVKLLECNPRINASIGFCWHAGMNLVYLRCKQILGELTTGDILASNLSLKEGMRMQKYYESEYYI